MSEPRKGNLDGAERLCSLALSSSAESALVRAAARSVPPRRITEAVQPSVATVDHDDALAGEERLQLDGADVGVVNSPCWSHRLNKSLALVHLRPDAATPGTRLQVVGDDFSAGATVETIPFFDPQKLRTHE